MVWSKVWPQEFWERKLGFVGEEAEEPSAVMRVLPGTGADDQVDVGEMACPAAVTKEFVARHRRVGLVEDRSYSCGAFAGAAIVDEDGEFAAGAVGGFGHGVFKHLYGFCGQAVAPFTDYVDVNVVFGDRWVVGQFEHVVAKRAVDAGEKFCRAVGDVGM